jgi:capsular exopolysaccharide synthesis family protein
MAPPAMPGGPGGGPGAPGGGGGPALTGKDLLRMVRRRKWLIIGFVVLMTTISGVSTWLWLKYAPLYRAMVVMTAEPPKDILGSAPQVRGDEVDRFKDTLTQLAKSQDILQQVITNNEVAATEWRKNAGADALEKLEDQVVVASMEGTNIITMTMTGQDAAGIATIVNALAREFQDNVGENYNRELLDTINGLQKQEQDYIEQIEARRAELKTLPRSDESSMRRALMTLDTQLQELTKQFEEIRLFAQRSRQELESFQVFQEQGKLDQKIEVVQRLQADPTLQAQIQQRESLSARAQAMLDKYGPNHRVYQEIRIQLQTLEKTIRDRENAIRDATLSTLKDSLERNLMDLQQQGASIRANIDVIEEKQRELQQNLKLVQRIQAEIDAKTRSINRITERLQELQAQRGMNEPVQIQQLATTPPKPYAPQWLIMIPLGVVLGLTLGGGISFLLEFMDTSIKSPSDVSQRANLPMLGVVPHTDDLQDEIDDLHQAFAIAPNSLLGESFRQIRTSLLFAGPVGQMRSLLITSPQPGDGRGTVTMNLGAAIAHGGRKVLIVDANFRQPMIRKLYKECRDGGLSNSLVGQGRWEDYVHEVEPNLHVMPAGPLPPNPAELLGSDDMRNLLSEMTSRYDQVLFDGAPCLVVTDPAILSTIVDGVILVVRAGANSSGVVVRTRDMIQRVGGHILGVILNGIRVTAGGYLRRNYETFYEYHEVEEDEDEEKVDVEPGQDPQEHDEDGEEDRSTRKARRKEQKRLEKLRRREARRQSKEEAEDEDSEDEESEDEQQKEESAPTGELASAASQDETEKND